MWRWICVAVLASVLSCSERSRGTDAGSGEDARHATDLDGHVVDPFANPTATTVLVFATTTCPISNRYAVEIRRLHDEFAPRGVTFILVYPSPSDSADAIRKHIQDYGYPFGALRDPHHVLVARTGVTVTPEVAVITTKGEIAYHGRIDDRQVDFGKARPEPTRRDLALALDAVLADQPVELTSTPAIGCTIGSAQ